MSDTNGVDKVTIDLAAGSVTVNRGGTVSEHSLESKEGFAAASRAWVRAGWDAKYVYGFSWMGRPIIQLPEDMIRLQELIHALSPDVIIETGVAHGGSLVYYASLCKAMGKGRIVGIDIEIRPHNRTAIEAHPLASYITLIEGSSVADDVMAKVRAQVKPGEVVLVLLDSNHTKEHVAKELELYGPLVTPGSWIVAMDGIMREVVGAPRTKPDWSWNNPADAANEYLAAHPEFTRKAAPRPFNEGLTDEVLTYFPDGWLQRTR